jgi:hypothetical protein
MNFPSEGFDDAGFAGAAKSAGGAGRLSDDEFEEEKIFFGFYVTSSGWFAISIPVLYVHKSSFLPEAAP